MSTSRQHSSSERKLAAIMFTDIVGYTALMGQNSAKALELVRISKDIQKPLVENHNGKWLKEMGDGILVQFNTALDAVNCAIEIQENARAKFEGKLRIGIHLGDITIENEDVYGDGVNVASRLESIADPGGIYISDAILKAIQGHTDIQTKYLGEISLKNVSYALRTYTVQGVGLPVPVEKEKDYAVGDSNSRQKFFISLAVAAVLILAFFIIKPVPFNQNELKDIGEVGLAIMPLKNISSQDDIDFLSYALKDEIHETLALSKKFAFLSSAQATAYYKDKDVTPQIIGDELGVDYLLSGSYQISGDQLNVRVEFSDVETGNSVWTDKFLVKYEEANIFPMQTEIALKVLARFNESNKVVSSEKQNINFESYRHYAKGLELKQKSGRHEFKLKAIEEFKKAVTLDSTHTLSWLELISTKSILIRDNEEKYEDFVPEIEDHLKHLSNDHPQWASEIAKGIEEYYIIKNYQGALEYFYKVIDTYPDNEIANSFISYIYKRQHRIRDAYSITLKLIDLDPKSITYWKELAKLFEINGDYKRSLTAFTKALEFGRDSIYYGQLPFLYEKASIPLDSIPSQYRILEDKKFLQRKIYAHNNPRIEIDQLKEIPRDKEPRPRGYTDTDYYLDMAYAHFGLYQDDSVAYYANLCIEASEKQENRQWWHEVWAYSLLGNMDKSVEIVKREWPRTPHPEDLFEQSNGVIDELWLLLNSKNYPELTKRLTEINKDFPEFGNYYYLTNYAFDRAKKEYPPFAEAVANLKLPAPLVKDDQLERLKY